MNNLKRNKMKNKETLEDFIRRESKSGNESVGILKGVIWQKEKSYSEEEVKKLIVDFLFTKRIGREVGSVKEWFEQFKKKQNEKDFN